MPTSAARTAHPTVPRPAAPAVHPACPHAVVIAVPRSVKIPVVIMEPDKSYDVGYAMRHVGFGDGVLECFR